MDRLAENIRVKPTNRAEAIDFTRSQTARAERSDDVESRVDQRVNDRRQLGRANEKPERFSAHLEEQHASQEPRKPAETPDKTQPTPDSEPRSEQPNVEPEAQPVQATETAAKPIGEAIAQANATAAKPTGEAIQVQTSLQAEDLALEIPAPAPITQAAAPSVPLPIALPIAPEATPTTRAPMTGETLPAVAAAPTVAAEKSTLEVESSTTKLEAPRADNSPNQVQSPSPSRETPAESTKVEAPRETPAARSAHEVERAADILRQIRVQLTPELCEARIQLQPIELGRVSIHLTLEEGRMKTVVRAEKPETLQAIQTHLPELRASLRQHGIDAQDFQLLLGFENRERPREDNAPTSSNTRRAVAEMPAIERSSALHAAVSQTGVDFYA